ncbi:hypothetical protein B0A58_00135 [Flavobacterium branchiophilum NBRC 15030 = ATCC 35035]|uniref:Putative secreted protein (Por secretion system target) n=1 Tax=Flavobacterium branchiophilum TaxID=55197 RepID=A0A543G0P8_9FLAO|nr:T9SS type A sorting domain-containing protein [Flavobacterium branchiophilum]OXA82419.1 hypothetical protein B0A58_00135 [Flavobacterium branchiophilum NBRC 15030 = ATCC 35035]TQM39564.1 putative secreted protein (Por secretion system target) [Flavobacterium branchiophilum]
MKNTVILIIGFFIMGQSKAQNFSFNFNTVGRRVCLVSSKVDVVNQRVKLIFHDSLSNTSEALSVHRRLAGTHTWSTVATQIAAGTGHWTDFNTSLGQVWEYQVKRHHTWTFSGTNYDAVGYTMGALLYDNTNYKGQMILLVANDVVAQLPEKYTKFKKELTNDGWYVNELIVPRATSWDSGVAVYHIKNDIISIYNNAPLDDKPQSIVLLGHVPMPRCGASNVVAPDDHSQNTGARGCDGYYADIDGLYTDTATYNPSGLSTTLAQNMPNDYKWDQDFFPSDVEMSFGRIDFADLTEINTAEHTLLEQYLDRLSQYKNVATGFDMGEKAAFFLGYNNSNDGSYRTLCNIAKPENVFQKTDSSNHNQWVQNNGPFKIYMQNVSTPSISDWQTYGMNATVFSSDQSYWGFGDVPQPSGAYSRIRVLLGLNTKCLLALWTTTGLNIFHQACYGKNIGQAMKDIINHNETNQYLEKPPQQYDTPQWWNRTHFDIWGDPTINLYQVKPIANLAFETTNGVPTLTWTASNDEAILGYHVYESATEFGKFQQISNTLISNTFYQLPNASSSHWYMVKAIKKVVSGCGTFLQPSMGLSIKLDPNLQVQTPNSQPNIVLYPNPFQNEIQVQSPSPIKKIQIYDNTGRILFSKTISDFEYTIPTQHWTNGSYFLEIQDQNNGRLIKKLIKNN